MVLTRSGRKRPPKKKKKDPYTFKQRKDLPGHATRTIPKTTLMYRAMKRRTAFTEALAEAGGVTVAELTSESIAETLKLIHSGQMKIVDGAQSLLPDETISQLKQQGEERLKGMLSNPGVVAAALAETGISIQKYEQFVSTLLEGMKGVVASRQAQGYSSMAVEEVMDRLLPLTESADGEFAPPPLASSPLHV